MSVTVRTIAKFFFTLTVQSRRQYPGCVKDEMHMCVMFQAELVMAKLKTKMTAEEWRKYVHLPIFWHANTYKAF